MPSSTATLTLGRSTNNPELTQTLVWASFAPGRCPRTCRPWWPLEGKPVGGGRGGGPGREGNALLSFFATWEFRTR